MYEALRTWYDTIGVFGKNPGAIELWTPGGYLAGTIESFSPDEKILTISSYNGNNKKQIIHVVIDHIAAWA